MFKRSPRRRSSCDYKDPTDCNADYNCYWDYYDKECRRKRSPEQKDVNTSIYYRLSPDIPSAVYGHLYSYLVSDKLLDSYPHNPELFFRLLPQASRDDLVLLLNNLPDGDDWFLNEIYKSILKRFGRNDVEYILGLSGHYTLLDKYIQNNPNTDFGRITRNLAEGGHIDIIQHLISRISRISIDKVLEGAALGGHLNIAQYAIDNGANHYSGALQNAATRGHIDIINLLLPLLDENDIYSGLIGAARNAEHPDIFQDMLRRVGNDIFEEYLNMALEGAARIGNWNYMSQLIERGADINNHLVLENLGESGDLNLINTLIDSGRIEAFRFYDILSGAFMGGHLNVINDLIKRRGTEVREDVHLICAAENGHIHILERFITPNSDLLDILQSGVTTGYLPLVEYIVNLLPPTENLSWFIDHARNWGNMNIVSYLEELQRTSNWDPLPEPEPYSDYSDMSDNNDPFLL